MKNIKGILFDMDGVIVDSESALKMCCIDLFSRKYGITATQEDFAPFIGTGEDEAIGGVMRLHGGVYTPEVKEECYSLYETKGVKYAPPAENIKETIARLGQKYRLAVASSADRRKVKTNLSIAGLTAADFNAVITGSDVEHKKPDPEIYFIAAKAIDVLPENCLVVEDAVAGVLAAKAAGCRCVAVAGSFTKEELMQAGADFFVEKTCLITDLLDM